MQTAHTLSKLVEPRRALEQRKKTLILGIFLELGIAGVLAMLLIGCAGGSSAPVAAPPIPAVQALQVVDVQNIVQAAVNSVNVDMAVAVVDRAGFVLGVFRTQNAPAATTGNLGQVQNANDVAVALARTGAFFSNDQAPLSSRTVRFISGIHFPPGVQNAPNGALYGIENTNRGCTLATNYLPGQQVPIPSALNGGLGLGIITGKPDVNDSDPNAVNPGGVPIFENGVVIGGVGVAGVSPDIAEYAAFAAATSNGFGPMPAAPGVVFIDGVALPFVNQTTRPAGINSGTIAGSYLVCPVARPGQRPGGGLVA